MDENYHIFSDGTLSREQNTLRFDTADDSTYLPVETVDALYCYGQVRYNTQLLGLLNDNDVELHVFGWNGQYVGSHVPRRSYISGQTIVKQVATYLDEDRRLSVAREMVSGSIHNMRKNLVYYRSRRDGNQLDDAITELDETTEKLSEAQGIDSLMGFEATARKAYYSTFDDILTGLCFRTRTYRPPESNSNALISFVNSLVYANVVSAIRRTALEPSVSFLHEPGDRRYSLSLDIADVFKPLLSDRLVFRLANRSQITSNDFRNDVNGHLLTEHGRKTVVTTFEEQLEETIEHQTLNRHVSYKYLLQLEAYKLKKHVLTGEPYEAFRRWW
ncbi:type I-B CRISPR-associated endonuclease Cas1b [Halegenticoccus tardaugens]|uniref:type I-B CRISPR-associated endonuclease Cas1b n=1 Tax=Halegenticoccus tardaugens TaxID=2071624 RepID=UPI00100BC184|nr:type I-B CRISPR-associated endonuclease Cas1b [Halegenticoccus tardaugens]